MNPTTCSATKYPFRITNRPSEPCRFSARDIAFYEAGSAYDPAFEATSDDGEIFLGWYTEDGTLLTDLLATQDLTVTARWQSDDAWV